MVGNWPYQGDRKNIYLKPGELCITKEPAMVSTVLGSCVSVTLFHRTSGVGAICHTLQPKCPNPEQCQPECKQRYRYTVCTIEEMSRRMRQMGIRPKELEVKLFGGAALIGSRRPDTILNSIGQQNVKAAMATIDSCGLILKVMDVGGSFGRKLIFDTATGDVLMKRLNRTIMPDLGS